jgi:phytanoyl-CoA hydroxylase
MISKHLSSPSSKGIYIVITGIIAVICLLKLRFESWNDLPKLSDRELRGSQSSQVNIAPPIKHAGLSSNVDLRDFSIPQPAFTQRIKNTKSADTTDGWCHAPFVPIIPDRFPVLDEKGMPISDCWIDRPDAQQILAKKLLDKKITSEEAKDLAFFMENGFMILDGLGIDPRTYEAVDKFVDSVWKDHPSNLLMMNPEFKNFQPSPFSEVPKGFVENFGGNGSKLMETHAHTPALLALILNKKLHRYMHLIYDDVPVATQSLYFRVATNYQPMHRDPWYVQTRPPGNMMASWVALEDIYHGSGELEYIVGSHKLPYKTLDDTKDIVFVTGSPAAREAHVKEMWDQVKAKGLKRQAFAPKKGQALIWHANLIHGGGAPYGVHANKTRKSFVVHYDLLRKRGSGRGVFDGKQGHGTNKLLRHDCNYVLSDPMLE